MLLRNFIYTLRTQKTASALNILGLTIALAAFYVIASQVWYAVTFNSPIENSDRIYIVSPDWNAGMEGGPEWHVNCPQPATRDAVAACPDAELYTWFDSSPHPEYIWDMSDNGNYTKFNYGSYCLSTDAIRMFGFKSIEGDLTRISEPNSVIISKSAAENMGCEVGDPIWFNGGKYFNEVDSKTMMTVVGIFEDFPKNTFLYNHHVFRDDRCIHGQENNNWNYSAFVQLKEGADPDEFIRVWQRQYKTWYLGMVKIWEEEDEDDIYEEGDEKCPVMLVPLDEMYFFPYFEGTYYQTGSKNSTIAMAAIAILIMIIAFINFFNFYMALVPSRMRGVNINKVLGASLSQLRIRLVLEAVLLTLLSFCLCIVLLAFLKDSTLSHYVSCSLALKDNIFILIVIGILSALIACVSAIFPAIYTTGANTSMSVKGGFAQSKAGRAFRSFLVGLQFTISMALIIITSVFFIQYRYMVDYDLGFDTDDIMYFSCSELAPKSDLVIERLKEHPDITAVTAANANLFYSFNIWGREIDGRNVQLLAYAVRWDFPQIMGISVIEGEGFSGENTDGYQIMFTGNTMAAVRSACEDGLFEEYEVKGVIEDIRLNSVGENDTFTCLYTHPRYQLSSFFVRTTPQAEIRSVQDHIRSVVAELEPRIDEPRIWDLNEYAAIRYSEIRKETTIIGIFALIAVIISLMGVFSIVMFETRHKESEISIRKVYGATVEEIVRMFNRRYTIIVALCFLIATPTAWIICNRWLQQFANRIPIPLWVFPAVLAVVLAITMTLVSLRSLRAARTNPAEALKKE